MYALAFPPAHAPALAKTTAPGQGRMAQHATCTCPNCRCYHCRCPYCRRKARGAQGKPEVAPPPLEKPTAPLVHPPTPAPPSIATFTTDPRGMPPGGPFLPFTWLRPTQGTPL